VAVVIVRNLTEVMAGWDKFTENMEFAAEYAVAMAGLAVERQAKLNANTGTHKRGQGHIPGTGPGPNVVTGNLRRSIRTDVKYGFGSYVATVGAYAEYARAVELGSSRWKSGVKYPYLGPAADTLRKNGTLNRVFTQAFARKMKGQ
jgi:hypothetical protein